jgi:hypothetical protein
MKSLSELQRFSPYLAAKLNLNLAKILGLRLAETLRKTQTKNPFAAPGPATTITGFTHTPWSTEPKPPVAEN